MANGNEMILPTARKGAAERLNRIEGQIKGIRKIVVAGKAWGVDD